jgi:hypothetical protein
VSKYFAPKQTKVRSSSPHTSTAATSPASTSTHHSTQEKSGTVRFNLISGKTIDLVSDTIEEFSEMWANKVRSAVFGCKEDGTHVAIPFDRIDYVEGNTNACNQ